MNVDFDFETLYKNERISLKEVFDTISQHIKTEDIINKLTEKEILDYYDKFKNNIIKKCIIFYYSHKNINKKINNKLSII